MNNEQGGWWYLGPDRRESWSSEVFRVEKRKFGERENKINIL
jgi:hypothetical protein